MRTLNAVRASRGLTLIELVIFIVVVGIGVVGILSVYTVTVGKSADPLVRKQSLAIAEALLEEVQLMPFTFCDPDDPNAPAATTTASCTVAEANGPEAGETRYSAPQFDNVNDYDGFTMTGIRDVTGNAVAGLGTYSATVSVTPTALGSVPASDALLITVSVTGPSGSAAVTLHGYRTRYAPRAMP